MALSVNSNPHKILIIDDEPLNILALCAVLKSRGYQTVKASTAKEGLHKLFNDDSISIILMDIMMPEIDGYEATALIRGNKNIGNIPIVAVTAQAMSHDKEKCLAAGINDYVSKPIDIDILTKVIKKYIK